MSDEETYQFNAFLRKHPEYKEIVEGLTLADLDRIELVNNASIAAVKAQVNAKKRKAIIWVAAAVIGLVVISQVFNLIDPGQSKIDTAETGEETGPSELIALDTSVVTPDTYQKEIVKDTFYYVNTDDVVPEVAIEFIEEKEEEKKIEQPVQQFTKEDSLPQSVTMIADNNKIKEDVEETYAFIASLDYRQSIAVEDNVAGAYKVGQTKSFAGPIGGYEYDPKGMPHFGEKEGDFYAYIESQLSADTLLAKISKKMEARVSFEVDNKGNVENVNVVKCNHKQLCMKLTEIFEQMPDWQPADFKGKKGSVHYVIQVNYE